MRRFLCTGFAICVLTGLATAAEDPVATADKALMSAFEKGGHAAIEKYLDADFTWIDRNGVMVFRSDALALGMKPLVGHGEGVEIVEHPYGDQVVWLQAHSGDRFVARFWVKRPAGWRLLHTSEIAVMKGAGVRVRPTYDIPCINPCKQLPIRTTDKV